jgi:hypothetical protein
MKPVFFKSAVYNEYKNNDKPVLSSCAVLTPFGINMDFTELHS